MNHSSHLLSSFELYLKNIGFIDNLQFHDKQREMIISPSIIFIYEPLAKNDVLSPSLNKTLDGLKEYIQNDTITYNSLYTDYIKITTQLTHDYIPYCFQDFVNGLSIFEYVISGFNKSLLKISLQMVSEELISLYFIDETQSLPFSNYQLLIKNESNENKKAHDKLMLDNFLFLFFIFSCCGRLSFTKLTRSTFINNLNVYNKFYISHLNYGLLIHLTIIILCNLFLKIEPDLPFIRPIGHKETYTNQITTQSMISTQVKQRSKSNMNIQTKNTQSRSRNQNCITLTNNATIDYVIVEDKEEHVNLCVFDKINTDSLLDDFLKIIICLNSLKCFLYKTINSITKFKMNLTIRNPRIFKQTSFAREFEMTYYSKAINSLYLCVISKENLIQIFKKWEIDQLIIELNTMKTSEELNAIFSLYDSLIGKGKDFHLKDISIETDSYMEIDALLQEWILLKDVLNRILNFKESNKRESISYSFTFKSWKMKVNKSLLLKEIFLYFDYSNIQEKTLLAYFLSNTNFAQVIKTLMHIITLFEGFKGYTIGIRLFQNTFRSKQLEFYIQLIINMIINKIRDKKTDHIINIFEKSFNNFDESMQCYVYDPTSDKKKHKLQKIKHIFSKLITPMFFRFLNPYLEELIDIFDFIQFSEEPNSFKFIRTFTDNKLFFILSNNQEELPKVQYTTTIQGTINQNSLIDNNYIMKIYIFLNNKKESYLNSLPLLHSIKINKLKRCNIDFTLICDKTYFETNVLVEPKFRRLFRYLAEDMTNIYIISKKDTTTENNTNNTDYFNYDIYLTSKEVLLYVYNKIDIENDFKYQKIIYTFISIISNCLEMTLYLLKNKDNYDAHFSFIYRTVNESQYQIEFKNGSLFIKKSNESDNLMKMNMKNAVPLFAFISKKETSSYTMSNENFYDVFLRLFLNLNKVSQEEGSLNEVFFKKLHKNFFYEYYEDFYPIAFSNDAFELFHEFFLNNDYLMISQGQQFLKGFLFPFDSISKFKNILRNDLVKDVTIFKSSLRIMNNEEDYSYRFFSFSKIEYIIKKLRDYVKKKDYDKQRRKIYGYIKKRSKDTEIALCIMQYIYYKKRIEEYHIDSMIMRDTIDDYLKEKSERENQKVENRVVQLTEAAKNEHKHKKDDNCCII